MVSDKNGGLIAKQPDFRGPRPASRGGDTSDIGRVATFIILHKIYSNVHQLVICWIHSKQSRNLILQVATLPISGVSQPAGWGPLKSGRLLKQYFFTQKGTLGNWYDLSETRRLRKTVRRDFWLHKGPCNICGNTGPVNWLRDQL